MMNERGILETLPHLTSYLIAELLWICLNNVGKTEEKKSLLLCVEGQVGLLLFSPGPVLS